MNATQLLDLIDAHLARAAVDPEHLLELRSERATILGQTGRWLREPDPDPRDPDAPGDHAAPHGPGAVPPGAIYGFTAAQTRAMREAIFAAAAADAGFDSAAGDATAARDATAADAATAGPTRPGLLTRLLHPNRTGATR